MNEKHPNRKKDKHNPYTLMIVEGRYYLSFKDGRGVMQNIEIDTKAKLPTHTEVKDFDKLDKDSIILLEQIRTIDKQRLKQYIGLMPDHIMARVDKALAISISLDN